MRGKGMNSALKIGGNEIFSFCVICQAGNNIMSVRTEIKQRHNHIG